MQRPQARRLSFDTILARITDTGAGASSNELDRNLLHSYVCLLNNKEL